MKNNKGLQRFERQLKRFEKHLNKKGMKNPALDLYHAGARTPLFMLEGLARVYRKISSKAVFKKHLAYYKMLEDALGVIDHYEVLLTKTQDPVCSAYFLSERKKAENELNMVLSATGKKSVQHHLSEMRKEMQKVNWPGDEEAELVSKVFKKEFKKVADRVRTGKLPFKNIENIHEMRRKFRWLSIYSEALNGLIFLDGPKKKQFAKYRTRSVTGSRFNKLPKSKGQGKKVAFDKDHFLALSWLVMELGKIKDEGILLLELTKASRRKPVHLTRRVNVLLKESETFVKLFLKDFDKKEFISVK